MKRLILTLAVALSSVALLGCAEPTPEQKAADIKAEYLTQCTRWGINNEAYELGATQKYKDRALLHYYRASDLEQLHPELDRAECEAEFGKGEIEGRRRVNDGKVDMQ
ncbi:MAG: hypothetical protein ACRC8B_22725 [Aeromonas sobria]|uniref:hypothetical protein n=1 Tax=Aeromonas sobria TaxID=646 RepID=UPI003F366282